MSQGELETIRATHVAAERTLVLIAWVAMAAGLLLGAAAIDTSAAAERAVLLLLGGATLVGGAWLRRLRHEGRGMITAVLVIANAGAATYVQSAGSRTALQMLAASLVFACVCAWALWNERATNVLSEEYQATVLPRTADVRGRTDVVAVVPVLLTFCALVFTAMLPTR